MGEFSYCTQFYSWYFTMQKGSIQNLFTFLLLQSHLNCTLSRRIYYMHIVDPFVSTIHCPSCENATDVTQLSCPPTLLTSSPLSTSHTHTVLSHEPATIHCPSCENATDVTQLSCPSSLFTFSPLSASHTSGAAHL